jgi:hypothetical protein
MSSREVTGTPPVGSLRRCLQRAFSITKKRALSLLGLKGRVLPSIAGREKKMGTATTQIYHRKRHFLGRRELKMQPMESW